MTATINTAAPDVSAASTPSPHYSAPDGFPITEYGIRNAPASEFAARQTRVDERLEACGCDAMVFFSADSITYLTGSPLTPTERPIAFIHEPGGRNAILVPRLELEHAEMHLPDVAVTAYPEYPGEKHPLYHLKDLLSQLGLEGKRLAADSDGYPPVYGSYGPALSEVLGCELTLLPRLIQELKVVKSPFELELMRESARWSNLVMALLQEYTRPGLHETDVSFQAGRDASHIMLQTLGGRYSISGMDTMSAIAGYRGQIGVHSYYPHAVTTNAIFRKGDLLGCYGAAYVLGYSSELERNFFMGEPSDEQRHYYELICELQQRAIAAIRPGEPCSAVDEAVRAFYKEKGLEDAWRHHTGHCLGSGMHENPVFDTGDHTELVPGMVFSVEPGLYVEGVGGFRLSDTIAVHEDHVEVLTYYDRDIEHLTIEC